MALRGAGHVKLDVEAETFRRVRYLQMPVIPPS